MKLSDLVPEIKERLLAERPMLHETWKENTPNRICLTNAEGTRYFIASRKHLAWNDDKGNYMPFGGGSIWLVRYGKIKFRVTNDPFGQPEYSWYCSGEVFGKSANGTVIPQQLSTKKEVLDLIKKIGTLSE